MRYIFCLVLLLIGQTMTSQVTITQDEIKGHIRFLTSNENAGRPPGGKKNRRIIKYIKKDFKKSGLKSLKQGYFQPFDAQLRVKDKTAEKTIAKTWNVIGYLEGSDLELKNEYIVLGAHYDHLGLGGPSSKSPKRHTIHFGADDNASGTAALLESIPSS